MKKYRLAEHIQQKMTLIVSLTENNPEWAKAIENAGAHSIKVHLNVLHRASKTCFKSWDEEKSKIASIPSSLSIPVGIVPGAEVTASEQDMKEIKEAGFDYLDIFAHHMPPMYLGIPEMSKSIAVDYRFPLERMNFLEELGADIFELSIIPPDEYGQPLTVRDLAFYKKITSSVTKPVFIPTQRQIKPSEVQYLRLAGASGIAIGAVVTEKTIDKILRTTEEFRKAIDKL